MNKQEAIERIEQDKIQLCRMKEINSIELVDYVPLETVINIFDKISETQKVTVPKFVAEWIEGCKRSGWHLQKVIYRLDDDEKVGDWAYDENDDLIFEKVDVFARAWLDGYEVESEKLYTVQIPNPNSYCSYTFLSRNDNGVCIDSNNHISWKRKRKNHFTEAEIKKDFEWAFKFAKPVEEE